MYFRDSGGEEYRINRLKFQKKISSKRKIKQGERLAVTGAGRWLFYMGCSAKAL